MLKVLSTNNQAAASYKAPSRYNAYRLKMEPNSPVRLENMEAKLEFIISMIGI